MIAHAWALKSWYFAPLVSIDEYIEQTIRTVFVGVLTPTGRKVLAKWKQVPRRKA